MKIEEGKFYRSELDLRIGPMRWSPGISKFVSDLQNGIWFESGKATVSGADLIAEWPFDASQREYDPADDNQKSYYAAIEAKRLRGDAVDLVNHPPHYTSHPSGVECIHITEHMNFCRGNAVKYIWRADDKGDVIENLEKAKWYLEREIARLKANSA